MSGSGISWVICKSAPNSRKITMPEPYHSIFYRPDALPAAQSKVSKHWRRYTNLFIIITIFKAHQHKAAGRKTRPDIQNYGCNGNLLCYYGVVERNRISSLLLLFLLLVSHRIFWRGCLASLRLLRRGHCPLPLCPPYLRHWRVGMLRAKFHYTDRTGPDPHGPNGVSPQKKSVRVRSGRVGSV